MATGWQSRSHFHDFCYICTHVMKINSYEYIFDASLLIAKSIVFHLRTRNMFVYKYISRSAARQIKELAKNRKKAAELTRWDDRRKNQMNWQVREGIVSGGRRLGCFRRTDSAACPTCRTDGLNWRTRSLCTLCIGYRGCLLVFSATV